MNFFIKLILLSSILSAREHLPLNVVEKKLLSIDIRQMKFSNLCASNKKILKKDHRHIILWSIHCDICLREIKYINKLQDKSFAIINVDTGEQDQKKACLFLKKNAVSFTSLNDNNFFRKYIGDEIPNPTNLLVDDKKVSKVFFGYDKNFIK